MVGSRDFFIKARRILSILAQEVVGGSEPENNGKNKDSLWRNTLRKLRRDRMGCSVGCSVLIEELTFGKEEVRISKVII